MDAHRDVTIPKLLGFGDLGFGSVLGFGDLGFGWFWGLVLGFGPSLEL